MHAWDICRGHTFCAAGFGSAGHLSGLHTAGAPDFRRETAATATCPARLRKNLRRPSRDGQCRRARHQSERALLQPRRKGESELEQALDYAAARGVITVAAAGNQGTVGSSAITRHPWVIPVAGCDLRGRPTAESNLGSSIGRRGLGAPAEDIASLGTNGKPREFHGHQRGGAVRDRGDCVALVGVSRRQRRPDVKLALLQAGGAAANSIAPPLLDAWAAYESHGRRLGRDEYGEEEARNRAEARTRRLINVRLPGFLIEEEIGLGDVIKK